MKGQTNFLMDCILIKLKEERQKYDKVNEVVYLRRA